MFLSSRTFDVVWGLCAATLVFRLTDLRELRWLRFVHADARFLSAIVRSSKTYEWEASMIFGHGSRDDVLLCTPEGDPWTQSISQHMFSCRFYDGKITR